MPRATRTQAPSITIPADAHEWVSFEDPDEARTWVFDVTFLLSPWTCIFGRGCQGVLTGPAEELVHGCCSYGAHFVDEDDLARVEAAAAELTEDQWQFKTKAKKGILQKTKDGSLITKQVDGACVFLNRAGFARGAGCALHVAAMDAGLPHHTLKPDVCWQLPLHRNEEELPDGSVRSTIKQWDRADWGAGGAEFHWWCTESPDAFTGAVPVYESMRGELIAMCGDAVHGMLAAYLDRRRGRQGTPLRHPALQVVPG